MAKFVCIKCGKCCKFLNSDRLETPYDYWKKTNLSTNDIEAVEAVRDLDVQKNTGCKMLIKELDGTYSCLLHKEKGFDAKPEDCQLFPFGVPESQCFEYMRKMVNSISINDNNEVECLMRDGSKVIISQID